MVSSRVNCTSSLLAPFLPQICTAYALVLVPGGK